MANGSAARRKMFTVLLFVLASAAGTMVIDSCVHQPYVLPADQQTGDPTICFEQDILPIFQSNCAKSGCHNAASHEDGYTLDSYTNIVKKGIVPGNPAASKIWESVTTADGDDFMPRNAPALNATQLDLIKRWIIGGAIDTGGCSSVSCDTTAFTYSGTIAPLMQSQCTGCHNSPSASGGSLTDYNSVKTAAVSGKLVAVITHQTGYSAMPQGGAKLLDCQITQIKKWIAAGTPNN
jgi:hypothetical protein